MGKHETFDVGLPPDVIIQKIKKALHHGGDTHTWEDVQEGIVEGKYQIFWNDWGACITQVVQEPQCRYLNCFIVAGKLPEVMSLHDEVERFALIQNCKYMTTSARQGWGKVLPAHGWKKTRVVFVKELKDGQIFTK